MVIPSWPMTRRRLLRRLDTGQIEKAIHQAETRTSGEIRVSIVGFFRGDMRRLAERAFHRLGMTRTRHRNGVLILLAPTRRGAVILGDEGIHAKVGQSFWATLAESLVRRFQQQDFTPGVVDAIDRIGRELALHFPPDLSGNINEVPDAVDVGGGRRNEPGTSM
jgi:uncharacterized membrane protein